MKFNTRKSGVLFIALAAMAVTTVSCRKGCTDPLATNYDSKAKKDDGSCVVLPFDPYEDYRVVSGSITSDQTWTPDSMYVLDGKVWVENGATLTIQPGTIIKGAQGTESLASALVITRGAKINTPPQRPLSASVRLVPVSSPT